MNKLETELVTMAHEQGVAAGEVAIGAYILTAYRDDIPEDLVAFLERATQRSYEIIGKNMDKPAEDVALYVQKVMSDKIK